MTGEPLKVRVGKSQGRFKRVRNADAPDFGIGEFFLLVDVTALDKTVYLPISIASGKKTTGFVYQIEGTATGTLVTTDISCKGAGITQVTLGTILYAKITKGATATFRILVEIKGKVGKEYRIVLSRIHYKYNTSDARYERYLNEVSSRTLKFR